MMVSPFPSLRSAIAITTLDMSSSVRDTNRNPAAFKASVITALQNKTRHLVRQEVQIE